MPKLIGSLIILVSVLIGESVFAQQITHQLVRRVVVFPVAVQSGAEALAATADETWWQVREELTGTRRFLVASKQFLVRSDVFQPRAELEPADAIILGKLLDSHALITLKLADRQLTMSVYDGGYGLLLFQKTISLHPSVTVQEQLPRLGSRLVNDFVATIPYQGFTTIDPMIGKAVMQEGDVQLAQVELGLSTRAQIGDSVQWIRVTATGTTALFQGASQMSIFAEGKIVRLEQGKATVEITRATSIKEITEFSLVRVPREADRLQAEYSLRDSPRPTLTVEMVAPESSAMSDVSKERKPLVTTLSFVASIVAFLLLAF